MAVNNELFNSLKDNLKELDPNTRNSAITKLVSYNSAVVPIICSVLNAEGDLERKLMRYFEIEAKSHNPAEIYFNFTGLPHSKIPKLITKEENQELSSLKKTLRTLAGENSFYGETYEGRAPEKILFFERKKMIEGLLKVLCEIRDKTALATLEALPDGVDFNRYGLHQIKDADELFSKVKDAIKIIKTDTGTFTESEAPKSIVDDMGDLYVSPMETPQPSYDE